MAAEKKTGAKTTAAVPAVEEKHPVSELLSDRAAAPSPFGDEQTFPLPLERVSYISSGNW